MGQPLARIDAVTVETSAGAKQTAILLTCEHAVCDGVSINAVTHDLLLSLSSPAHSFDKYEYRTVWAPAFETACYPTGWFPKLKNMARLKALATFPRPTGLAMFPGACQ